VICVEVSLNGVPLTIAGEPSAESIEASVGVYPGFNESWLRVTGETTPTKQPPAHAQWASATLKIGDVVQFRLIESSEPSVPQLGRADTSVAASDDIPFICGFCGKPAHEVDGMMAGNLAMICLGCVRTLYGMLGDRDTTV
jgi:hypothetical protein